MPRQCGSCLCYYDIHSLQNILNCSSASQTKFGDPPEMTNVILLNGTSISEIPSGPIETMKTIPSLRIINMTNNKIQKISKEIQHLLQVEEIWLSGNPFNCDCEMTWMITWLNSLRNNSRQGPVRDYRELICGEGRFKGLPVHLLTDVLLGCYPSRWTKAQTAGVSVAGVLVVIIFLLTVLTLIKSREINFLMYYYLRLDRVPKDDKNENLDNKEHDAFLCFW